MVISLFYLLKIKFFIDILCDENDDISADDTDISIKKTAGKFQK